MTENTEIPRTNADGLRYNLMDYTIASLTRTLREGAKAHAPGSWASETEENHLIHAANHMNTVPFTDEELEHALCRLAMAWYVKNHQ